jgi:hypothetical protein
MGARIVITSVSEGSAFLAVDEKAEQMSRYARDDNPVFLIP